MCIRDRPLERPRGPRTKSKPVPASPQFLKVCLSAYIALRNLAGHFDNRESGLCPGDSPVSSTLPS
eukprot:2741281-Alexandrium_andersonii.AAC.1